MTAISPLNTPRLWVDYNDGTHDHSIMFRFNLTATVGAAMEVAHSLFSGVQEELYTNTIKGARMAFADSPVSFPVLWSGNDTYGSGAQPAVSAPLELCWVGRTTAGRMAKWFLYGFKLGVPEDYRFFPGVDSVLDAGTAAIRAGVNEGTIIAIDTFQPSVYPYINIQWNSYWESQARR